MFNVRIKRFYDAEQVQVFSRTLRSKGEISRKRIDEETGEILVQRRFKKPELSGEWMDTPFTDYEDGIDYFYDMEKVIEEQKNRDESIRISTSRTIKSVYDIARSNCWEWFFTFTFDPKKVDRYNYNECVNKFHYWLSNMKKVCPDMIYLVVPEQHKDGAYHFHGLFSNVISLDFQFSGRKDKKGRWIYNIGNYKWGFTTATRISDFRRASSYLCKYITKDLCANTMGRKRYWSSRNASRPYVEEYLFEESTMERLKTFLSGDEVHIKQVRTPYTDVLYIDRPIYTTNTDFSNRYMRKCVYLHVISRCLCNQYVPFGYTILYDMFNQRLT